MGISVKCSADERAADIAPPPAFEVAMVKVLDKGLVRLVDSMGDDSSVIRAARVSYGEGTKTPSDDRTLIRYLMRHWHTTPFEMVEFKFHCRVPMDCWRQWIRHRTASVNEYSAGYSEAKAIQDTAATLPAAWRLQATGNKQGSDGFLPIDDGGAISGKVLSEEEEYLHKLGRRVYEHRLEAGVAREHSRKDLPLSTYTEAYWRCLTDSDWR
jgi:thymidylate synthase (FAD)